MNKILIANRGEIAVRIIRACKEMNIKTVAIYSEADKDALHTRLADESVCIGPAPSNKSYLNIKNIIEAAYITGSDSIHPGFGFLSENSQFARICKESNIKFIGPTSEVIDKLGNKSNSKDMMKKAGVPVIPGSNGSIKGLKDAIVIAEKIGYPIMLKAAAGGGGKGIRIVNNSDELETAYNVVKQEAKISFNDDESEISSRDEQLKNAQLPIDFKEEGISNDICANDKHSENALFPIKITDDGISISLSDEHLLKTPSSISVIEEGIEILTKFMHTSQFL